MTTAVIHIQDPSTDFLKRIYKQLEGESGNVIVNSFGGGIEKMNNIIKNHHRVFMLGHGYKNGLIGVLTNSEPAFVVRKENVKYLEGKDNIFIFCYASDFVVDNHLTGFSSGMFISEMGEAAACLKDHPVLDDDIIEMGNNMFADILGKYAHLPGRQIYEKVYEEYRYDNEEYWKTEENVAVGKQLEQIITYNRARLCYVEDGVVVAGRFC